MRVPRKNAPKNKTNKKKEALKGLFVVVVVVVLVLFPSPQTSSCTDARGSVSAHCHGPPSRIAVSS